MSSNSPPEAVSANMVTTSNESTKGLKVVWTDDVLVSVLRTQKDAGNQASNGWKPSIWTVAAAKLLAEGSKKDGEKTSNKCSNHWTNVSLILITMMFLLNVLILNVAQRPICRHTEFAWFQWFWMGRWHENGDSTRWRLEKVKGGNVLSFVTTPRAFFDVFLTE
jgi:hypothetical protein